MKYLSLFSGIGTAEKGIEQAYDNHYQYESTITETPDSGTGWERDTDKHGNGVLLADHSAFRRNAECIGFAEIDKYAASIYKYHWPEVTNYGDATKIVCGELPDFDFLVGGFPCQAFSIAGKRQGFQDTRGTLFFEIARILEAKRPGHFLLENVAGLLSHDLGQTFRTIIATLDEIGYDTEWTIINSKHHGVPQNRERVFIVGHIRGGCAGEVLSFGNNDEQFDGEYGQTENISSCLDANYYKGNSNGFGGLSRQTDSLPTEQVTIGTLRTHKDGQGFREMQSNVAPTLNGRARQDGSQQGVIAIPVLTPDRPTKRQNGRRFKENGESAFTLTSQDRHGVMVQAVDTKNVGAARFTEHCATLGANDYKEPKGVMLADRRIRRLTPTECERLQGLADGHTKYGIDAKGNTYEVSDSQRYKTLGNAMTVNVIEALITRMLEVGCLEGGSVFHGQAAQRQSYQQTSGMNGQTLLRHN